MTADTPTLMEFVTDPQLLGLSVSPGQETILRAIAGLPLDEEHWALFQVMTGRRQRPTGPFGEATIIAGARAGKDSRLAVPTLLYEAIFGGFEAHLAKGERAVLPLVAQDQRATRVAFGYASSYLTGSPMLASMIEEELGAEIRLTNRATLMCFPSTLRSLRGFSIPAAVLDELGFFRLEGQANADAEIQASIRRGMLGFPTPRLVKISTPYMKSGVLYEDFKRAWGQEDPDLLVVRASTTLLNPTITAARLERERRLDALRFAREYEAEFAEDLEAFLPAAWVDAVVRPGRYELPPQPDRAYRAGADPSSLRADAFTLAIVHPEGPPREPRIVQDVMRGWTGRPTQSADLEGVVREMATLLKAYRLTSVIGDRYAAGWVRERFAAEGIRYHEATRDKSATYLEVEPYFAQGRVELLDHPVLRRELTLLERRPRPGGKTIVDHPTHGHDDFANALALAMAAGRSDPFGAVPLGVGFRARDITNEGVRTPSRGVSTW